MNSLEILVFTEELSKYDAKVLFECDAKKLTKYFTRKWSKFARELEYFQAFKWNGI